MRYLLNLLYGLLLCVVSPYLCYAAIRHGKYRAGWKQKLFGLAPVRKGDAPCIWLHAVSVGEINLLATLLPRLEAAIPGVCFYISSTTRTGYELALKKYDGHTVFYCPLDFSWAVSNAMQRIRPDMLVLAELELWPNLIATAARRGVKTAVINGRLSENSFRGYGRARWFVSRLLKQIDLIAVQNETFASRFRQLGASGSQVHVTGSVKFDGATTDRNNPKTRELKELAGISADDIVFLAGSTQHPEEEFALNAFRSASAEHPNLRLIITPRHPERFAEVAAMLDRSGVPWQRRTGISAETSKQNGGSPPARVLLVDVVGELGAWWGASHIAYVGGSMGRRGGQNMIEPAAYGAAVSFGPKTRNFRDVVALLLAQDAAVVVEDEPALTRFVTTCAASPAYRQQYGEAARQCVKQQAGAATTTVKLLAALHQNQRPHITHIRRAA